MRKKILILLLFLFQLNILLSQSHFVILGKTNSLKEGKAVLYAHPELSFVEKNDTVNISNYSFVFKGLIKYPEQRRIEILELHQITEPFFISSGSQKIFIDSLKEPHDVLDIGTGITMTGSLVNDEYFDKYLTRFQEVNKVRDSYYTFLNQCDSVVSDENLKICLLKADSMHEDLRMKRDSVLLNYTLQKPNSPLLPWLLNDAIYYYGYNSLFQQSFDKMKEVIPIKMKDCLDSILRKSKLTSIGNYFPLNDFISSNLSKGFIQQNKYTLIDFWFSKCRPCLAQFKSLKELYLKYTDNGFQMVAISIDKQNDIPAYEKILSQNNYPWKQILDTSGVNSRILSIKKYPSNFLLDNTGKIIAVDITPVVLDDYLEKHLNQNNQIGD